MDLEGQAGERGYAMAALLVSLAVMAVLMSAALPAWRHEVQREKEAELVFRGEQYARAVALFRSKNANAFPPSVDVLVQGKYLRKKYVDPITNKEFDLIGVGAQTQVPGQDQAQQGFGRSQGIGLPGGLAGNAAGRGAPAAQPNGLTQTISGGIMGVHSKSQETSIRVYKGQTRYDQWAFVFTAANRPGGQVPGALNPGGPGGLGAPGGRGGRGNGTGTGNGQGGRGPGRGVGPGGAGRGSAPGGSGGFELPPTSLPPAGLPRGRGAAGSDLRPPSL